MGVVFGSGVYLTEDGEARGECGGLTVEVGEDNPVGVGLEVCALV